MVKQHLKRIATPRTWPLHRKGNTFIKRPNPGAQSMEYGVSLAMAMRDMLNVAETAKEVRYVLKNQTVTINGNRVHDAGRAVSFMDVLGFESQKKYFRLLLNNKGKLFFAECPEKEKDIVVGKVTSKRAGAKKTINAHLNNGYNVPMKDKFKTGDSVVLQKKKDVHEPTSVIPYAEKSLAYVFGGKNMGLVGTITQIKKALLRDDRVMLKVGDQEVECVGKQTFIIGKDKPVISIPIKDNQVQ